VPLAERVPELREMFAAYRAAEDDLPPARRRTIEALREELDLDASLEDLTGISTVIRRAVDRSVKIVQNLRSFSHVSGESVPTDLHACIDETLMLLWPRIRQARVEVVRRFGEMGPVTCRAGEINQVFMNLLVNAIQALEGAPANEPRAIVIETRVEGNMAVVSVTDDGPGVPAELSTRIFDPFFTTKPRGQGTGLGLSISSDIARRHGGSLSLDPPPGGRGACLVCRLPLLPEARKPLSGTAPTPASRPTRPM
jgi:signal transduction histidine kinase